jgi:hypothetical protein
MDVAAKLHTANEIGLVVPPVRQKACPDLAALQDASLDHELESTQRRTSMTESQHIRLHQSPTGYPNCCDRGLAETATF